MAEALAGVGVAANVVQLLDVGTRLVTSARAIYVSSKEGVGELPDLNAVTKDLELVLQGLNKRRSDGMTLGESEKSFQELITTSQELANDLLNALKKAGVGASGSFRRRDAVRVALKRLWNDDISTLETRLDRLRHELMLRLLSIIYHQGQEAIQQQASFRAELKLMQSDIIGSIKAQLEEHQSTGKAMVLAVEAIMKVPDQSAVVQCPGKNMIHTASANEQHQPSLFNQSWEGSERASFESLKYPEMEDREERFAEAPQAFRWTPEANEYGEVDHWTNRYTEFKNWLQTDSKMLWITTTFDAGQSGVMAAVVSKYYEDNSASSMTFAQLLSEILMTNDLHHFYKGATGTSLEPVIFSISPRE